MPLVLVRYNPDRVPEKEVKNIVEHLPAIIAFGLSASEIEAHLQPSDVEVWVRQAERLDVNKKDFVVVILAGLYPDRERNLQARGREIAGAIRSFFSEKWTGFVWILLQPQAFEEW